MKKVKAVKDKEEKPVTDDLLLGYKFDYRLASPNRFASRAQNLVVILDPDVAVVFKTTESVNSALRALIAVAADVSKR